MEVHIEDIKSRFFNTHTLRIFAFGILCIPYYKAEILMALDLVGKVIGNLVVVSKLGSRYIPTSKIYRVFGSVNVYAEKWYIRLQIV